jgi:glucose-6-phosphate 1-dehydrogenase
MVDPIIKHWDAIGSEGMREYPAGSWGPRDAEGLLEQHGARWREPEE